MAAYGTRVAADSYHTARLNAAWTGSDAVKEAALLRASDWIDGQYEYRFPGYPLTGSAQDRSWPRSDAFDRGGMIVTGIPLRIEYATYEAALREIVTPGSLSPDYVASQIVTKEKVGAIEVQYADAASAGSSGLVPMLTAIDNILAPLLMDARGLPAAYAV